MPRDSIACGVARRTHRAGFLQDPVERRLAPFVFAAMDMPFKQLSPPALCALIAALGGLIGGATAVHGLKQNGYGPQEAPAIFGRAGDDGASDATPSDDGYPGLSTSCEGCSERDLGYRWAVLASIRSSEQCPNDSWGFRRGCLDYTGGV